MNKRRAVVLETGKATVITETYDDILKRRVLTRSTFGDIKNFFNNKRVVIGINRGTGNPIMSPLGTFWLTHPKRREYQRIVFAPGQDVPQCYNLWNGFSVEPRSGDWSLLRDHIHKNICRGDDPLFKYVEAWLAFGVQRPGEPAETALVMRGGRGTGKGVLGREYGRLFGQHFVHVAHARHLVGNFNAHLQDAVIVFADEAFGTSDKQAEAVLKMLITEETIPIERKFRDVISCKNVAHVIVASNNDWVVPAGVDERRFCVLDVSDAHIQDTTYFKAMVDQMRDGGSAAMLHDLMRVDLAAVDLRHAPVTDALREQKLHSLSPEDEWWYEKLYNGRLLNDDAGWKVEVLCDGLVEDFGRALKLSNSSGRSSATRLGMFLKKVLPPGYPRRTQRDHSLPADIVQKLGDKAGTYASKTPRKRYWGLPDLAESRRAFEKRSHDASLDWDEPEDDAA
jgi:hypothetical protein